MTLIPLHEHVYSSTLLRVEEGGSDRVIVSILSLSQTYDYVQRVPYLINRYRTYRV